MSECACCSAKPILLYSCSGAANTGLLADRVTRELAKEGVGSMTCLAAIGAQLSGFTESAKSALFNVMIDGCPVAYGKKIFETNGLPYLEVKTTDYNVIKGQTPITEELVRKVTQEIREKLLELTCGSSCKPE